MIGACPHGKVRVYRQQLLPTALCRIVEPMGAAVGDRDTVVPGMDTIDGTVLIQMTCSMLIT